MAQQDCNINPCRIVNPSPFSINNIYVNGNEKCDAGIFGFPDMCTNPMELSPFGNCEDLFGSMDVFDILLQQMPFLTDAFNKAPGNYDLGLPDINNVKQRKGAIPLSPECVKQIDGMAKRLNCESKDIQALIYSESGGDPKAVNKSSGATGLIQFMPKTAAGLGTSVDALRNMPAEQQLVYVEKYLTKTKNAKFDPGHKLSAGELYALVFMPAKADKQVLCSQGSAAFSYNKGLSNGNKTITKEGLGQRLAGFYHYVESNNLFSKHSSNA